MHWKFLTLIIGYTALTAANEYLAESTAPSGKIVRSDGYLNNCWDLETAPRNIPTNNIGSANCNWLSQNPQEPQTYPQDQQTYPQDQQSYPQTNPAQPIDNPESTSSEQPSRVEYVSYPLYPQSVTIQTQVRHPPTQERTLNSDRNSATNNYNQNPFLQALQLNSQTHFPQKNTYFNVLRYSFNIQPAYRGMQALPATSTYPQPQSRSQQTRNNSNTQNNQFSQSQPQPQPQQPHYSKNPMQAQANPVTNPNSGGGKKQRYHYTQSINPSIQARTRDTANSFNGNPAYANGVGTQPFTTFNAPQPNDLRKQVKTHEILPNTQVNYQGRTNALATPNATTNIFEKFNTNLFQYVGPMHPNQNVIYSPISLQTLLALIYVGARDNTEYELQQALQVPPNKSEVVSLFQQAKRDLQLSTEAKLITANKIYYNYDIHLNDNYKSYAQNYFGAEIEPTKFWVPAEAANQINTWVSRKTQNRINNIVSPSSLDPQSQAVLLSVIYFKAAWFKEFSVTDTARQNFYMSKENAVPVNMMYIDDYFRYGEFANINAQIVEMPYKDSDLSMLIILPYTVDGLQDVETRLANINLADISSQLKEEKVTVRLPKFKIEFELDMKEPLIRLGVSDMFSPRAKLTDIFRSQQGVRVSNVLHKAYIDVNEAGSEAAATSFGQIVPLSLPPKQVYFTANHPFMFAIRSPKAVLFVGHVVKF